MSTGNYTSEQQNSPERRDTTKNTKSTPPMFQDSCPLNRFQKKKKSIPLCSSLVCQASQLVCICIYYEYTVYVGHCPLIIKVVLSSEWYTWLFSTRKTKYRIGITSIDVVDIVW